MPTIRAVRQHNLGLEAARAAVEGVAMQLQKDLSASHSWLGDSLNFECPGAEGCIEVTGSEVRVTVEIGWLLGPMRGRIEHSINQYLDENLS